MNNFKGIEFKKEKSVGREVAHKLKWNFLFSTRCNCSMTMFKYA